MERQTTLLDIYFGGEFLFSQMAEFNTNEVVLSNPEAVVEAIPQILDAAILAESLSGALETNAGLRCYSSGQTDCGVLEPAIAGIIFNEDLFRVDVFINPDFLAFSTTVVNTYLPASDTGWSFLQNLTVALAGDDNDFFDSQSLNAASLVSWKENRFLLGLSYADISDWTADNILLRRDYRGRNYQGGYFQTFNDASLRFIPEESMRGFRIASTLDTRADLDTSRGAELSVFLVNRSRVSIFKDERLVSSRSYDAGNQVLDTGLLPGGAYPITLEIEDASGAVRREQRFYVKSSQFPPPDQLLWGVEVGELTLRNTEEFIPEALDVFYAKFSASKRVGASTALKGGIAARDELGLLELGISQLNPYFELDLNAAASTEEGYGASFIGRTRWRTVTLSINYRQTWADDFEPEDRLLLESSQLPDFPELLDEEILPPDTGRTVTNLAWFAGDSRQTNVNLTWFVWGGTFTAKAQEAKTEIQNNLREYTLDYQKPFLRTADRELYANLQFSEINGLKQGLVGITYRWGKGNFTNNVWAQHQQRKPPDENWERDTEYAVSSSWRDRERPRGDLNVIGRASHRSQFDDVSVSTRWRDRFGEFNGAVEHISDDNSRNLITGDFSTSFAVADKQFAFGGEELSRSAIVVSISGDQQADTWFDVMVNGTRRGYAKVGEKTLISLRPYQTYDVEILPRGAGFVSYEEKREKVTLYPGNVANLHWDASRVNIVFGRLLDQNGDPIENAVLRGASGLAITGQLGFFQAEIKTTQQTLKAVTPASECDIDLPDYSVQNGIAQIGDLRCVTRSRQ